MGVPCAAAVVVDVGGEQVGVDFAVVAVVAVVVVVVVVVVVERGAGLGLSSLVEATRGEGWSVRRGRAADSRQSSSRDVESNAVPVLTSLSHWGVRCHF